MFLEQFGAKPGEVAAPIPAQRARAKTGWAGAILITVLLATTGCATALNGRTQKVVISSEPSGAAVAIDGIERGTTPMVVALDRNQAHSMVVAAAGYAPDSSIASRRANYLLAAANLLLFHPAVAAAGLGVDILTGAHHRLEPQVSSFRLQIIDSTAARRSSAKPWQPVPIGSRIRLSQSSAPVITGNLLAVSGDSLLIAAEARGVNHRIVRGSIQTIELSLGPDRVGGLSRWLGQGALAGLLAGAAVGAIAHNWEIAYYWGTLFGLPGGMILGSISGAYLFPRDKWVTVR